MKTSNGIQKNKACPQCLEHSFCRRGFVMLFAVTLAAILLSIALGVGNITLKELKFSTSAKDTNDAFFAADTGAECAFVNDKSTSHVFESGGATPTTCLGNPVTVIQDDSSVPIWHFTILGLNSGGQGCAEVTVDKYLPDQTGGSTTTITSDGYNNGGSACTPTSNTVQREIQSRY